MKDCANENSLWRYFFSEMHLLHRGGCLMHPRVVKRWKLRGKFTSLNGKISALSGAAKAFSLIKMQSGRSFLSSFFLCLLKAFQVIKLRRSCWFRPGESANFASIFTFLSLHFAICAFASALAGFREKGARGWNLLGQLSWELFLTCTTSELIIYKFLSAQLIISIRKDAARRKKGFRRDISAGCALIYNWIN